MNIKLFSNEKFLKYINFNSNFNLDNWNESNWCFTGKAWRHGSIKKHKTELFKEDDFKGLKEYFF